MELIDKTVDVLLASPPVRGVIATECYRDWYTAEIIGPYYYPSRPNLDSKYDNIRDICRYLMFAIPDYKENVVWDVSSIIKFRFRRERDYMLFALRYL